MSKQMTDFKYAVTVTKNGTTETTMFYGKTYALDYYQYSLGKGLDCYMYKVKFMC